jgi:hypothetical protein
MHLDDDDDDDDDDIDRFTSLRATARTCQQAGLLRNPLHTGLERKLLPVASASK